MLTHDSFLASGKGDTTENCDPNLISNGNTKTALDKQIADNDKDPAEAPAESAACSSESIEDSVCEIPEQVEFTIVFNKVKHDITFAYDATVLELKAHLERICGVPQSAQKLIIKGMARDTMTLRKAGVVKGGKVMLVGSKMDDILAVKSAPKVSKQLHISLHQVLVIFPLKIYDIKGMSFIFILLQQKKIDD